MPWEVAPVSELRLAFVHQVTTLHSSVAEACREFGISRKTGYKWLRRYGTSPEQPLADRSRRPHASPRRTRLDIEQRILAVRGERELWPTVRRDTVDHFAADLTRYRCGIYNTLRPHEALEDRPPLSRYRPSPRPRPREVPPVEYPADAVLRKVAAGGDISYAACRILVGSALAKQTVRLEDHGHEIRIFYAWKQIRCIASTQLLRQEDRALLGSNPSA